MALSLQDISKKAVIRAPRILLLGVEKIGKSSFACGTRFENGLPAETGLNDPIVLPVQGEEGIDDLEVPAFPTLKSYHEVMEALEVLCAEEHAHRTVVVDSLSTLERMIWSHLCDVNKVDGIEKVGGGYGKGYVEAASCFESLLNGLDWLRKNKKMSSILIGHVKVKRFDDPNGESYDQYQLDTHDRLGAMASRWADLILFANTKTVVAKEEVGFRKEKARGLDVTNGQRFVYTKKRPAHPGGGRGIYGELPYELPLDWRAFANAVGAVIDNRNAKKEAVQ